MKIRRLNKKGDLMNNVFGIILAILGLLILTYGAYRLYQNFVNQESDNAKKTMDNIESKLNALQDGQSNDFIITGFTGSTNWFIFGWGKNDVGRPEKCFFNSCICICRLGDVNLKTSIDKGQFAKSCQDNGFCRKVESETVNVETFPHPENNPLISGSLFHNYIRLESNLLDLKVSKNLPDSSGNAQSKVELIVCTATASECYLQKSNEAAAAPVIV